MYIINAFTSVKSIRVDNVIMFTDTLVFTK